MRVYRPGSEETSYRARMGPHENDECRREDRKRRAQRCRGGEAAVREAATEHVTCKRRSPTEHTHRPRAPPRETTGGEGTREARRHRTGRSRAVCLTHVCGRPGRWGPSSIGVLGLGA